MGSYTSTTSDQDPLQKSGIALGPTTWDPLLYHILHHPEAAGLTRCWNGLLKGQRGPAQRQYSEGLGAILKDTAYAGDHNPPYGACSN